MAEIVLRSYQKTGLEDIIKNLQEHGSNVAVSPTGSGKTIIAGALCSSGLEGKGWEGRIVITAPRVEHERQFSKALGHYGIKPLILRDIKSDFDEWWNPRTAQEYFADITGVKPAEPDLSIIVSTYDTLISRIKYGLMPDDVILVIIDEVHHCMADSCEAIFHEWPYALHQGFTATPWRMDGRGLGDRFGSITTVTTYGQLRKDNAAKYGSGIVDSVVWEEAPVDLSSVRDVAGDYNQGDLEKVLSEEKHVADVVRAWEKRGKGIPTGAFSATVKSARILEKRFQEVGARTRLVHAYTDDDERKNTMSRLGYDYDVLVNVGVATEGTDIPQMGCGVIDRPTKSIVLWRQIAGRFLRPWEGDDIIPKKEKAIIIESGGNVKRHGLPDSDVEIELQTTSSIKNSVISVETPCKECGVLLRKGTIRCYNCGAEQPKKATVIREPEAKVSEIKKFRKVKREDPEQPSIFSDFDKATQTPSLPKPKRKRLVTGDVDKHKVSKVPFGAITQKVQIKAIRRHPKWKLGKPEYNYLGYNSRFLYGSSYSITFNCQRFESNYKGVYKLQLDPEETELVMAAFGSLIKSPLSYTNLTYGGKVTAENLDEFIFIDLQEKYERGYLKHISGHGIKLFIENFEWVIGKLGIKEKKRWNGEIKEYPKLLELICNVPGGGKITLDINKFRKELKNAS